MCMCAYACIVCILWGSTGSIPEETNKKDMKDKYI